MAVRVAHGQDGTGTGTTTINIRPSGWSGITPTGFRLWSVGRTATGDGSRDVFFWIGAYDGTTNVCYATWHDDGAGTSNYQHHVSATRCGVERDAGGITGEMTASFVSGGVDLTINTAFSADLQFSYAVYADDVDSFYCGVETITSGTGTKTLTGFGFQPTAVEAVPTGHLGTTPGSQNGSWLGWGVASGSGSTIDFQGCFGLGHQRNQPTTNTATCSNNVELVNAMNSGASEVQDRTRITSFDSDGITLTRDEASGDYGIFDTLYLMIAYGGTGAYTAGEFDTVTNTTNQSETTSGNDPALVLFGSGCQDDQGSNVITDDSSASFGCAISSTDRSLQAFTDQDGQGTQEAWTKYVTTGIHSRGDFADGETSIADFVSMDVEGFTWVMDTADPTSDVVQVFYLAIGDPVTGIQILRRRIEGY